MVGLCPRFTGISDDFLVSCKETMQLYGFKKWGYISARSMSQDDVVYSNRVNVALSAMSGNPHTVLAITQYATCITAQHFSFFFIGN